VTYRDDRDADRARIDALEGELAQAQKKIADLEHQESTALVRAGGNAVAVTGGGKAPWYGAPLRLELTRRFDGEFPREQLEDLIALIRRISREPGHAELLKSSMTWSANMGRRDHRAQAVVNVAIHDGVTDLTVTDSLGQLAGATYGAFGAGVSAGTLAIPIFTALGVPLLIPVAILGWLGGSFFGARTVFKRAARRRAEKLQSFFATLSTEIENRIASAQTPPTSPTPRTSS
jgi:hypothetical protein